MSITSVLAVVTVTDFDAALAWYARLLGRPADTIPMPGLLADWQLTPTGGFQVVRDVDRAGNALVTINIDSLEQQLALLAAQNVQPSARTETEYVLTASIADPDGNTITFTEMLTSNG